MTEPPLTAADVRAVTFTTTRIRAGYDMDEVDAFLDRVEQTIAALTFERDTARDQEAIQRTQLERLQARVSAQAQAPSESATSSADPIVREIRERLRKVLSEQLALLDQFAGTGRSSAQEPPR